MEGHPEEKLKRLNRLLAAGLILLALAAAVYFRFANLKQYPGWYSDEGNHIDLAENWMQGRWQNYGVVGAPYSQRLPLYMYAAAGAMNLFGVDITVSRGLSAAASLICLALAAWIAWKAVGLKAGILTLWVGAIAPWIVTFSRLGLTYNLMAPFFLFSLIAAWYYLRKFSPVWLMAAGASAALAFATDYLGLLCGVTVGLVLVIKRPRAILLFGLSFLGTLILVLLPVLLVNPGIFLSDLWNTLINRGGVQSTPFSLISILINYSELLRRESWILLGLGGLFLIKDHAFRNILLTAVGLTLVVVTKAYTPVGTGLHYLMHLFPIFALGLAVVILQAFEFIQRLFNDQLARLFSRLPRLAAPLASLTAALIVFSPLVWMLLCSYAMISYNTDYIFTGNDDLRLVDRQSAEEVRTYVAAHVSAGDLVMGSPALIWGLPTMNRADFLAALAYNGYKPQNYIDVDKTRFQQELTLDKASFVILDPLAEEFAPQVLPGMDIWLDEIHRWPVVFTAGDIRVYHH